MAGLSLRRLEEKDWEAFRSIRLEALRNHPDVFNPSTDEFALTDSAWQQRLANPDLAIFAAYDGETVVGMTGVRKHPANPTQAHFIIDYLREEYRGKGYSRLFYEARFAWCREQNRFTSASITHRDTNLASEAAIKRHGFALVRSETCKFLDGSIGNNLIYERPL